MKEVEIKVERAFLVEHLTDDGAWSSKNLKSSFATAFAATESEAGSSVYIQAALYSLVTGNCHFKKEISKRLLISENMENTKVIYFVTKTSYFHSAMRFHSNCWSVISKSSSEYLKLY